VKPMILNDTIYIYTHKHTRGPFEKFVDWWHSAAVMQREA